MSRYRFIEAQRGHYPVRLLCQLVQVPASGYYAWQQGQWQQVQQQAVTQPEPAWEQALVKVFGVHKRCYGTRRLQVALRKKGHRVGRQRLRAAMRRRGLHALQPKAFTPRTTDSTHGLRCAPNRLLDQPKPTRATQVWMSDSTYLPLATSTWAYWCAFQAAATKHVVSWHVRGHHAGRIGYHGLAAGPTARSRPNCLLRPRRPVRRQRLLAIAARPRGRANAEAPRRVRR